jgi:galactose mutarotase-like enzyme
MICLRGEGLKVTVAPEYGARIANLIDRSSGRDWLVQGPFSSNVGENAAYLAAEAAGWDECFPNVERFEAPPPWARELRDHGEVWGRPWTVIKCDSAAIVTRIDHPNFSLVRSLRCEGRQAKAGYVLQNKLAESLPFLWAAHILLAVEPGDVIAFETRKPLEVGYVHPAPEPNPQSVDWPGRPEWLYFDLSRVQPRSADFAAKLYAAEMASRTALVTGSNGSLRISWSAPWNSLGIWLNYGGWPSLAEAHHIALEPTTRPSGIFNADTSAVLAPLQRIEWQVTLDLT